MNKCIMQNMHRFPIYCIAYFRHPKHTKIFTFPTRTANLLPLSKWVQILYNYVTSVVFFTAVSFQALENSKAWASQEHDKLVNKLKMAIQEKDKTIEVSYRHHTARLNITVPSVLYFVILIAMPLDYLEKFCFIFLRRD